MRIKDANIIRACENINWGPTTQKRQLKAPNIRFDTTTRVSFIKILEILNFTKIEFNLNLNIDVSLPQLSRMFFFRLILLYLNI